MADILGTFEQAVLLAIVRLEDDAYGRGILREVQERLSREVAAGAVHATLERLEAKGLVRSRMGTGTPIRDGRARRFYRLSSAGVIRAIRIGMGSRAFAIDHHEPAIAQGAHPGGVPARGNEAQNLAGRTSDIDHSHSVGVGAGDIEAVLVGAYRQGAGRHPDGLPSREGDVDLLLDVPRAPLVFEDVDKVSVGTSDGQAWGEDADLSSWSPPRPPGAGSHIISVG